MHAILRIILMLAAARVAASPTIGRAETPAEPALTPVFESGKDGWPEYRIPSLVTTNQGALLALCEGRRTLSDHAENDIVLKRSTDGGRTWGELIIVHEDGRNVLVNPCAVVLGSGRVLLMYQRFPAGYHARAIGNHVKRLEPGLSGSKVCTTLVTCSDDNGKTWSTPRDVTKGTKRGAPIVSTATGPGRGIQLQRGPHSRRILMPTNESWWDGKQRFFNVYACFSDDEGVTWTCGGPAPNGSPGNGNEVQMVELENGFVMLNCRSIGGNRLRKIAVSDNGGQTWSPLVDDSNLPEPQCMGSVLRYDFPADGKSGILYAGPGTARGRRLGTIKMSYDDGKTWPVARVIYEGGYAYSCLTRLKDGSVGLLFEKDGYKSIAFARFPLTWLTDSRDCP